MAVLLTMWAEVLQDTDYGINGFVLDLGVGQTVALN